MWKLRIVTLFCVFVNISCSRPETEGEKTFDFDAEAIVVGGGIAGLSAAVEMGREGIDVLVLDFFLI